MPVYEARFLVQAESQEAAREAIRVPNTPHTEPILEQWGYHSQIDEDSAGVYQSTLGPVKSKIAIKSNQETPSGRKPRSDKGKPRVLSPEQIAKMQEGRRKALEAKKAQGNTSTTDEYLKGI